jgi:AraC family transcriptional regulator of adaptative response/methylated-DNA-[protein]-cysteine methyltransferase
VPQALNAQRKKRIAVRPQCPKLVGKRRSLGMSTTDYARVEKAIRYLEQNARRQPKLAEVAAQVGLSEFHFQRLFQRWAGISPKRFLQCLTAGYAEELLKQSPNLLDAAYAAGLSSPSRLHGLFVRLHAVTPAQWRSGGAGVAIRYGFHDTPFGRCLLALTDMGVCHLGFVEGDAATALGELRAAWPGARLQADAAVTRAAAMRIFSRAPERGAPLQLWVRGSPFQVKVWQALLRIPPGAVASYGDVAAALGAPQAARAVGSAVAQNAIAYLIPCHRVIRQTGVVGDYRWGGARKKAMLAWESGWNRFNEERFMAHMGLV